LTEAVLSRLLAALILALMLVPATASLGHMSFPQFETFEFGNGLTVCVAEDHFQPVVLARVLVLSGAGTNPRGKAGLEGMTARAARAGIPGIDTEVALEDSLGRLGARCSQWTSWDATTFSLDAIAEHWREALGLLASVVTEPSFPRREVERIRDEWLVTLEESRDNPGQIGRSHVDGVLYGDCGLTERELRRISREDIVEFHGRHYLPNNTVVLVIGDFETTDAVDAVEEAFDGWTAGERPPLPESPPVRRDLPAVRLVDKPGLTQATVVWCQPGARFDDPDHYACRLANHALGGGGFSSRLMKAVRVEHGKTYGIGSIDDNHALFGTFRIQTSTRNDGLGETMRTIRSVTDAFVRDGLTQEEFEKARSYMLEGMPVRYETPSRILGTLCYFFERGGGLEDLDRLEERYQGPDLGDVRDAFARYVHPEEMVWVVVGDADVIADDLRGFGSVERRYYLEPAGDVGSFERTRFGLGVAWNAAVRGPRITLLHRWFGLSAAYGFERADDTWGHDWAYSATVDAHRSNSEYSDTSLYVGLTYLRSTGFRNWGPHLGFRIFPGALGESASLFLQYDRPIWLDKPASGDAPEGLWSFGLDWYFR
jgi:zinc protease